MSFVLYAFAKVGGNNKQVVGVVEVIGILLYLSGSYINTHSEYSRHVWKLKEENRGRLYTRGLFSLSMHINYFGDIVLFTGLAMVTHSLRISSSISFRLSIDILRRSIRMNLEITPRKQKSLFR
jgi:steroid 5-alpha reductase family enzyme